jgi:6-phosphogluconolactonase
MEIVQCETSDDVAIAGASFIHARAGEAVAERNQFTLALSGGSTPWRMLGELAEYELPWERVKIVQVDERAAADGNPERNLVHIQNEFADRISLPANNLYAMPVTSDNLEEAAGDYERDLIELAGQPPVLDVVHLGLGGDGHTASLVPGDPVLDVSGLDVATTGPYDGRRRMTLTYSIINRARHILWLITGEGKAEMLDRMIRADRDIPAGRVSQTQATVVADAAALSIHIQK